MSDRQPFTHIETQVTKNDKAKDGPQPMKACLFRLIAAQSFFELSISMRWRKYHRKSLPSLSST